jgi:CTP:molybdopterin cytidylyltransferase MocA
MPVTTAVVLGGGLGRRFGVLTSRDSPKALLPVANAPLLSYPIEWVAASGLQEALIVAGAPLCCHWPRICADALYAAGDAVASAISRWVSEDYKGSCKLTVIGALARTSHSTQC